MQNYGMHVRSKPFTVIVLGILFVLYASLAYSQELPDAAFEREPIAEPRQDEGAAASNEDRSGEQRPAIDYSPIFERIESAIRDLIPEVDQEERQRQEQREIADLNAQQKMALWAKRVFWASLGTIIITLTGLFLIWRTLHHTRRAADSAGKMVVEAEKTTAAANDTITATRDISRQELRAYIAVDPGGVRMIREPRDHAIADVIIRNAGRVPAREVKWIINQQFSYDKRLGDFGLKPSETEGWNLLAPGSDMTQGSPQFPAEGMGESPRDYYLYVWGAVFYKDGVGGSRGTTFCHRYNCVNFSRNRIAPKFGRFHRYGNDAN